MSVPILATALLSMLPQGPVGPQLLEGGKGSGGTAPMLPALAFPTDAGVDKFAPFVDALGLPAVADVIASGAADLDGDRNQDLWFVGATTPWTGSLSVQMARTSSLGRYRNWHWQNGSWADAGTYRSSYFNLGDSILGVDPTSNQLIKVAFTHSGNIKAGTFFWTFSWAIDFGSYELAICDDAPPTGNTQADGHDDIVLLATPTPGVTRIRKLRMGVSQGFLQPEVEATLDVNWPLRDLQLLDWDGDGIHDILATIPGLGILLVHDDGKNLTPAHWLPLPSWIELLTGDANRDGRDDLGIVDAAGVMLGLSEPSGWRLVWLPSPATAMPLGAARVIGDRQGLRTSIAGLAADGKSLVLWPFLGGASFGQPQLQWPADLTEFHGSGANLTSAIVADLDNDDDQDVVVPMPDRVHWLTLRNGEDSFAPRNLTIVDLGNSGETYYRKYAVHAQVPPAALARGWSWVELAVLIEDVRVTPNAPHIYWGRLFQQADATTGLVTFYVWSLTDLNQLNTLLNNGVAAKNDGISAGGDAVLSLHLKQAPTGGPQRGQSTIVHHDGDGDGNKSAIGVKWTVNAAPPKPSADTDLLPWD